MMYGHDVTKRTLVVSQTPSHASDARPERSEGRSNATRSMSEANATLQTDAERACAFLMTEMIRMTKTTRIILVNYFIGVPTGLLMEEPSIFFLCFLGESENPFLLFFAVGKIRR